MTLKDYLTDKGRGSTLRLAEKLKTSDGYLYDIANGKRNCSVKMAKRIEGATGGLVKASTLLGLDDARAA